MLTVQSTLAEWLNHPAGGRVLRQALFVDGITEDSFAPILALPLRSLIGLSQGRFSEGEMWQLVAASKEMSPDDVDDSPGAFSDHGVESMSTTVWVERIVPERFVRRTIIVTGAGSGIGRATASRIAREGGRVIAVDVSEERLHQLGSELDGMLVVPVVADITNADDIDRVVVSAGPMLTGLANVAGIMDDFTPVGEVKDAMWDRVLTVNLTGMMKLTRAVMPVLVKNGGGTIVNVASEAGLRGSVAGVAYTSSKHGVIGLTRSTAFIYAGLGVRANAVAPGAVITNIHAEMTSPLGRQRIGALLPTIPAAVLPSNLLRPLPFFSATTVSM